MAHVIILNWVMIHALLLFIYIIQWHAYTVNSKINATVNVLVQYKEMLLWRCEDWELVRRQKRMVRWSVMSAAWTCLCSTIRKHSNGDTHFGWASRHMEFKMKRQRSYGADLNSKSVKCCISVQWILILRQDHHNSLLERLQRIYSQQWYEA